jgi:copper chaperone CopZ
MITRARVEGMTCQHCVRAVFTALAAVEGIARAEVGLGSVVVEHDGRVTVADLREAVAVAGYNVSEGATHRSELPLAVQSIASSSGSSGPNDERSKDASGFGGSM